MKKRSTYSIFTLLSIIILLLSSCSNNQHSPINPRLFYSSPARTWNEALPIGNGRLGAMVFGGVEKDRIQFNEETLWTGEPHDYAHQGAYRYLDTIRQLLFNGKPREAENLAMDQFMSVPLRQKAYQPFGDIYLEFPDHAQYTDYQRELNLSTAIAKTSYLVNSVKYTRELVASEPDQSIAIHLTADKSKALSFNILMDALHEQKMIHTDGHEMTLEVAVKDGVLKGVARLTVQTNGKVEALAGHLQITDASKATILLTAATNYINYNDVSADPAARSQQDLDRLKGKSWKSIRKAHLAEYQGYCDRFTLDFGSNGRDTLPMDERLRLFGSSPDDPSLVALYVQYGRYLMISSSRPGTRPATLQGIWNQDLKPAWDSKYTTNINAEMNYWPAEITNLSDCHDPLFSLIEDCSVSGQSTARQHYNCDGWVLHHNTDIWRGTAPINHSNHGMWMGGSGWLCSHLWEHYLFTQDEDFLRDRAWPIMKEAARFYSQFLIPDPVSGWLISTPSNSPENGGMVAGPTMDHQIIRSLFRDCVEATEILGVDQAFAQELSAMIPKIAPNQIGQYGQLQEWMEDKDNPNNHHRHVSHLWGVTPGSDITWESSPKVMEAAKQSLIFRGDEGTGWSLAWKINFWARFMEGNHAYELIKMLFRVKEEGRVQMSGGGSYINLFDAHPPFQIDGNFGASAGIVEMLIQSHQSVIDILPALPDALPNGSIHGVCARGGFELSFAWKEGKLTDLKVLSKAGKTCRIRYNHVTKVLETKTNEEISVQF